MPSTFSRALLVAVAFILPTLAHAAQPYEPKPFQAAQAANKPILVEVTAPWCPTCRQQKPIVQQIAREKPDLVILNVDFDSAKDVLKQLKVQHQSTLIVYRGAKELARSTGETDPTAIRGMIGKAF
ncbi:thioredoxin family protein [Bradyrhizobium sp. 191]|uniref:thioredoxin family protein n=1 Tax=Bradyrhizobium sp. 191 TaxID=2782659 RepID=UPI001FFFA5C5|nr:thioredoxin family protein [Bradyrhizobium sp. 191]UPJ65640.1 thioredoxin family protein [Bradyrhizobium sp. 191]